MKSYVVRVYRLEKGKRRAIVGTVEDVGVKGKKAFSDIDELWDILVSQKDGKRLSKQSDSKTETDRRNERRLRKDIPVTFLFKNQQYDAHALNCSKHGMGLKIDKKIRLPIGNIIDITTKDSQMKAETQWVDNKSHPYMTMAGFKIVGLRLPTKNYNG
jgi:hypothetical protein